MRDSSPLCSLHSLLAPSAVAGSQDSFDRRAEDDTSDPSGFMSEDMARGGAQLCTSEYTIGATSSFTTQDADGGSNGVGWTKALNWKNLLKKRGASKPATSSEQSSHGSMKDVYNCEEEKAFGSIIKHGITDTAIYFLRACRDYPSVPLITFIVFSLLVFVSLYFVLAMADNQESKLRTETQTLANELSQAFSSQLDNSLLYAYSLSSYALNVEEYQTLSDIANKWPKIVDDNGTQKRQLPAEYYGSNTSKYDSVARSLISLGSGSESINNIQMAPAGIVSYIYPLAGNEGAIGHDLLRDPNRREASIATIKKKGMVMVGPLTSIQGTKFIIGRLPVFIDRKLGGLDMRDISMFPELEGEDHVPGKNFWGFTTVLFSWDIVVNQSRLNLKTMEQKGMLFNLTQTSMDSTSATAEKVTLYLNSSGVIREGVRADVEAPGAVWHLDLEPSRGFYPEWPVPLCVVAVVVCIAMAVLLFVALIASRENQKLVSKMLPAPAARHLLRHPGKPFVQAFEHVAIFFSDIVGYTSMAKDLSPIEVMELLNEVYSQFDIIAKNNDVYKVETIGDSYMVICGAPTPCSMNEAVAKVAKFGLEVLDCMSRFQTAKGLTMEVRCGMSSGSVVAGIVGTSMPRYCIFGDTVNMSSRMESTGLPGRFQTDASTAKILFNLKDEGFMLAARERTGIQVKGKGRQKTFFIQEFLGEGERTMIVDFEGKGRKKAVKKTANKSYAGASMDMANHDLWRSPSEESRLAKEGPGDEPQEIPLQNSLGNWVEIERMEPQDTIRTPSYDESVVINIPAGLESGHT